MLLHRLPTEHSFALLDQLSVDDLPAEIHADPVIPRGLENASHLMPLMIDLRALAEVQHSALVDWLEASLQRCGESPIACWLKTQASPTRIRSHLAARLVVRSGNGERCLLRYYDPKVFAHLRWILNAAQLGELFGPVSGWTYWLDGGWRLASPAPRAAGRARPSMRNKVSSCAVWPRSTRCWPNCLPALTRMPSSAAPAGYPATSPAHSATAGATSGLVEFWPPVPCLPPDFDAHPRSAASSSAWRMTRSVSPTPPRFSKRPP